MAPEGGSRTGLHDWLASRPGSLVLQAEVECINGLLPDLFGYHCLQVGRLGDADLMADSRILNRLLVEIDGLETATRYPLVRARAMALPVESDSVDVVILPHVLEFEDRPHEALREALRVLVAEGHLVVCGFNPWSPLGLWRLLRRGRSEAPWRGQFLAVSRIRDWLALLGFDLRHLSVRFFRPPFGNERLLRRLAVVERVGERLLPFFGGVYVIMARKRVTTLTPIRPRWKPRHRLVGVGLAGPSARVSEHD
jgi:SAM-dependent methyltransferase